MKGLVEERHEWREKYKQGGIPHLPLLESYRKNRDSELWRSTRQMEQLCEYILYLEEEIKS